ncbi:hypothetical protein MKUB_55760 [Mycobacterium kubicae]|uniref:Uncharacterized protein n=1 Tax=Mycobacterium kubicae TaxID=120959 RepID=A0ABQ1BWN1_9MYCO|nr:hypothetical protein [Mycobacterium kubicae]GFG68086.1 hypothetical protein MKUB_55760 [Mycobacterium kubicae]
MTNTLTTASDVVTAAMSIAEDAAQGRLDPAALEAQAAAELTQLFGTVVGPDDLAWPGTARRGPPGARPGRRARRRTGGVAGRGAPPCR